MNVQLKKKIHDYSYFLFTAGVIEKKSGPKLSCILSIPNAHQFKFDEKICLCLERYRYVTYQLFTFFTYMQY